MDSSVVVSLIGAGSALLGSLIGGALSSQSLARQINAENLRHFRNEKVEAYTKFLTGYTSYMGYAQKIRRSEYRDIPEELSALHQFSAVCSAASLLAPSSISTELKSLFDLASRYAEGRTDAQAVGEKYIVVEELLRTDLEQSCGFKYRPKQQADQCRASVNQ